MFNIFRFKRKPGNLGRVLNKRGFFARADFRRIKRRAKAEKLGLAEVLLAESRDEDQDGLLSVLSEHYDLPVVWLRNKVISSQVLTLIPKDVAKELQAIIFKKVQETVYVATTRPDNQQTKKVLEKMSGCRVKIFLTTPKDIKLSLSKYDSVQDIEPIYSFDKDAFSVDKETAEKMAKNVPVIKLVNEIVERGLSAGASDIHIEPSDRSVCVRYRVDGLLRKVNKVPKVLLPSIVARIKIMANVKIDEHLVPQDGRFRFNQNDREIAVRVSIIPTSKGPKVVMRLLDSAKQLLSLSKLGLNPVHLEILKREIESPQGMILVTGPTGSGKTTTLYTILDILNKEDVNICTIEDPIEYDLENINQMQANPRVGLTFAQGLRSLLRQDPDVIMVGEIRDPETGEIAMNAAMTGHLVLSTLHANNAFLAPQRLVEMNVELYLVSSVINVAIGQRLLRRLCPDCRVKQRHNARFIEEHDRRLAVSAGIAKLKKAGLIAPEAQADDFSLYRPKGCRKCGHTGYRGRLGIYEVISFGPELRRQVLSNPSEGAVRSLLGDQAISMTDDGILKTLNGITTFDEVMRVTRQ